MNRAGYTSAATHGIPAHVRVHTDTRHTHLHTHKSMIKIALAQAKTIDKPGMKKKTEGGDRCGTMGGDNNLSNILLVDFYNHTHSQGLRWDPRVEQLRTLLT